ncbi:MAG: hypothetical protein HN348_31400, partial [Proteobacteria bacterium]|nr:hypothetical protein [Pseudomonadota bacterium]
PKPLWEALYPDNAHAVDAAQELMSEAAIWITTSASPSVSLLDLVSQKRCSASNSPPNGDPVSAIESTASEPWTIALTALTLGAAAEVTTTVQATPKGVVVQTTGGPIAFETCGTGQLPEEDGDTWPARAVLAQAAAEAAIMATHKEQRTKAIHLAQLAEALDSLGTEGLLEAIETKLPLEPADDARAVGRAAGHLVSPVPGNDPTGAGEARRSRARALVAAVQGDIQTCTHPCW